MVSISSMPLGDEVNMRQPHFAADRSKPSKPTTKQHYVMPKAAIIHIHASFTVNVHHA